MTRDYLGVGVAHPAAVNEYGSQALVQDVELIKQSLRRIFETPVGSDFMNRSFGSHLHQLRYEQNDAILKSLAEYFIYEAVERCEKRVRYYSTDFEDVGVEQVNCKVNFLILASSEIDSFVYPFYRETRF